MNDDDTTNLLGRLASRVEVGPVPLQDVIRSGQKARVRRRRTTVLAATAAVALVVLGGVAVRQALQPGRPATISAGPDTTRTPAAPAGTRLVGIGHAAIAVPADWGTNQMTCGKPTADTVVIDEGMVPLCATTLPQTVSDVRLEVSPDVPTSVDFSKAARVNVDGVAALKTGLRCAKQGDNRLCTQALWIKQEQALFTVTSPRARTVRRLLDTVRVEKRYVAVPVTYNASASRDAQAFGSAAKALGLQVDTRVVHGNGAPAGWIVKVDPAVGTVLRPGDTVHVTVSAGPGPQGTASPGTASPGTASPATGTAAACPVTPAVQRLVVTRSLLSGNRITFSFPPLVTVRDPGAISALVGALCATPKMQQGAVYNCPMDNGLQYEVDGFNGAGQAWAVDVHASGCTIITGMGQGRWATGPVWHALAAAMGVDPPTYRTLAGHQG